MRISRFSEDQGQEEDKYDELEIKGFAKNKYSQRRDKLSTNSFDGVFMNNNNDINQIDGLPSPDTTLMISNQDSSEYFHGGRESLGFSE